MPDATYVSQLGDSMAQWALDAAAAAVLYLFHYISQPTDPIFAVLTPAYNRVLAMSLLFTGGVIALALIEQVLGGRHGAGPEVVLRTLAACAAGMLGLPLMRYATAAADLLATAWTPDVAAYGTRVLDHMGSASGGSPDQALGSSLGMIVAAGLTVLLAVFVHVELVLRAALLALTAALMPMAFVLAIWPRLARSASHLVSFILALLMSKFVMATAIYLGFAMLVEGSGSDHDSTSILVTGLATLAAAALSPILLFQGIRFAEASTGHATRALGMSVVRSAAKLGNRSLRQVTRAGHSTRRASNSPGVSPMAEIPAGPDQPDSAE